MKDALVRGGIAFAGERVSVPVFKCRRVESSYSILGEGTPS